MRLVFSKQKPSVYTTSRLGCDSRFFARFLVSTRVRLAIRLINSKQNPSIYTTSRLGCDSHFFCLFFRSDSRSTRNTTRIFKTKTQYFHDFATRMRLAFYTFSCFLIFFPEKTLCKSDMEWPNNYMELPYYNMEWDGVYAGFSIFFLNL